MDEIKSKLFYEPKNGYDLIDAAEHVAVEDYCRGYMEFLNTSRTEREAVANAIAMAKENGARRLSSPLSASTVSQAAR